MRDLVHAATLLAGVLLPGTTRAEVAAFMDGCVANAADLSRLPAALARQGMTETDPASGPAGPMLAAGATARRLWASRPGVVPEAWTGLAEPGPGRPLEVCWHVSRPGDSAAHDLAVLRERFPPIPGSRKTGTEAFYGGFEQWAARVDGTDVFLGGTWAMEDRPQDGTALLYLVRIGPAP